MILLSLQLKNFKQYDQLELEFKEGLSGIVGRNGAGKSSIFSAVLLCLFGEVSKLDKKYFRSSWATSKDPVSLSLRFEVKSKQYRVLREFRGKVLTHQAQLFDHKETALATGVKPVAEAIADLIGMDKDSFTRSIFSGQKELGEISNTQGEERRKMIRKMVGLDKLDKVQNIIREDRNKIKNQIKGQENLLYDASEINSFEKELKEENKKLATAEKEGEKINGQLQKKQTQYQASQKAFEIQNQQYKQHNELLHDLNKFVLGVENFTVRANDLKIQIKTLKETELSLKKSAPLVAAHEKQKTELVQLDKVKSDYDQIHKIQQSKQHFETQNNDILQKIKVLLTEIETLPKSQQELEKLKQSIEEEQKVIDQSTRALAQLHKQQGSIQGKIADRAQSVKNISQLGKEADCPTCFQPLLNTYDQTIAKLQTDIQQYEEKELSSIQKEISNLQNQLETLKANQDKSKKAESDLSGKISVLEDKQKQLEVLKAESEQKQKAINEYDLQIKNIGSIKFDSDQYQQLKTTIQDFEQQYINYKTQQREVAKLPEQKEKLESLETRIKNGAQTVKEQEKKIKTLGFKEEEHIKALEKQQKLEQEKDEILQRFNDNKDIIFQLKADIQKIDTRLKHNEKILKAIQTQRDEFQQLETLDLLFSKFKTDILERVKPVISHHASHLFNQITKGRYESIQVDNNFEFHIFDNGDYYPITRFSGGEIDLANLCLRIGISKAISDLSGSSAANSLLCFDEIFGSQDEERRFEILNALDLLKEQFRQIYIISHVESIKDHFPNILQVRKTPEGSTASWT